jgi:hypothetical protein
MFFAKKTWVLDDIFDPNKGWQYPAHQVGLHRGAANDGNPYYTLKVDGIDLLVFEQREWKSGVQRNVPAGRLVAMTTFHGIQVTNPSALLRGGYDTRGLPSFGLDDKNLITLHAAFPISQNFPADVARGQLLVSMGTLVEEANELRRAWLGNPPAGSNPSGGGGGGGDWGAVKGVASVAGSFLRGLLGI